MSRGLIPGLSRSCIAVTERQAFALAQRMLGHRDEAQPGAQSGYSEKEAEVIGDETRRLLEEARRLAHEVLVGSRAALDRIAAVLLERETLSASDVEAVVQAVPVGSNGR